MITDSNSEHPCASVSIRGQSSTIRALARDDRGVAALEGILAFNIIAGVFLACFLLTMWGTGLQTAQMGARLMAFNATDTGLAKLNKGGNRPTTQSTRARWDSLLTPTTANWVGGVFTLRDSNVAGNVSGTARGKLPAKTAVFAYSSATMAYNVNNWAAGFNQWAMTDSVVQSKFLHIAYYVGLYQASPSGLDSTCARPIPHGGMSEAEKVLDSIYVRTGVW